MSETRQQPSPLTALTIVLGVVSVLAALGLFLSEQSDQDPNYGPAMFFVFAGGFLILIGVVINSGRRR